MDVVGGYGAGFGGGDLVGVFATGPVPARTPAALSTVSSAFKAVFDLGAGLLAASMKSGFPLPRIAD